MKLIRLYALFFLLLPLSIFAQDSPTVADTLSADDVYICVGNNSEAFHSIKDCVGLDTCTDSLQVVSTSVALRKYKRKECCRCWKNPLENCADDNPDYGLEEEGRRFGDDIYFDDFWWAADGGQVYFAFMALGSVVILSNEVFVAPSYTLLPPKLGGSGRFRTEPFLLFGLNIMFRKNLKLDAFEYGINYHEFDVVSNSGNPPTSELKGSLMFAFSYLHLMNQHFSENFEKGKGVEVFAGPLLTFGRYNIGANAEEVGNRFGVGATGAVSFPIVERLRLELRGDFTNYSSELKLGLRWWYQKKYPWQKRREGL